MGTTTRQTTRPDTLNYPTGTITFTLTGPNLLAVDTETVTVNGNGDYTTPTGFALTAGTLAGTYSWTATYSGGPNNNAAIANSENVTVAAPTLTTAAKSQRHPFSRQRHAQRQCAPFWRLTPHRESRIPSARPRRFRFHPDRRGECQRGLHHPHDHRAHRRDGCRHIFLDSPLQRRWEQHPRK